MQRDMTAALTARIVAASSGDPSIASTAIADSFRESRASGAYSEASELFLVGDPRNPERISGIEGSDGFMGWVFPEVVRAVRDASVRV